jgi:hypothetical protein
LRKVLFFSGLTILLTGLVLLSIGSVRSVTLTKLTVTSNSWQVSQNLTEGHTYVLDIYSSAKWRDDWDAAGGYDNPQPVEVVIISPDGGETELQAFFYAEVPSSSGPYGVRGALPSFVQVEYKSVDYDSLHVDASYPQARFIVEIGGNYTAEIVEKTLNWTSGPPEKMIFEEEITENPNLFTSLLESSGVACLFTGAIISAWGARASKKISIKQTRKSKNDQSKFHRLPWHIMKLMGNECL